MPKGIYQHQKYPEGRNAWNKGLSKEQQPMYGKHLSEDAKQKVRKANIGKRPSEATKKKLSEARMGTKLSEETKSKISEELKGEKNPNWKGDNVGYYALHDWVIREKGKPQICKHCGDTKDERRLYWCNIDHKYRRNLNDYISLCASCHRRYDIENNLIKRKE